MRKVFIILVALSVSAVYCEKCFSSNLQLNADSIAEQIQTHGTSKTDGDSAYIKKDYDAAIMIYEDILKQGESAEIYYNLGNSYYKSGNIAKAILNYERALLLQPSNPDIRANLDIARAKTIDKITPIPENFLVAGFKSVVYSADLNTWAVMAIACFGLFLLSLCLFLFSRKRRVKKTGFIFGILFFLFTIACNIFAQQQKNTLLNRDKAIVISPSVTVHSTPSESGTKLFVLHEGHKIEIKDDSMRDWKEICLEDGKVGWIPAYAIEII